MHSLTILSPNIRKDLWRKYNEKMQSTKGKRKEEFYEEMAQYYHVHHNTIRKVIRRARIGDFTIHISTTRANLGYQFKEYAREERRVLRQLDRETSTDRYPYNPPHESLLIGGFFLVFESTESLEKFDIRLETHALYFK